MTRKNLIDFCLSLPSVYEDYPFDSVKDGTEWAVMRHKKNQNRLCLFMYETRNRQTLC
jgi:predicted DNA-binding protein (MmcQ/YjbR family)